MTTKEVGEKLVGLVREGKTMEALDALYSPDIVSVEAGASSPDIPAEMHGIEAIRGKNKWWFENHETHSASAEGPFPHNDKFAVVYHFDVTPKTGPMAGNRFTMDEVAVYTVENDKIVREEFYYSMG